MDQTPQRPLPPETADLRPFLTRLWARILHVPREPPKCDHCHHVTEMATTVRFHNKLLWIVAGAFISLIIKWGAETVSARLRWVDPGPPASLVGAKPLK